MKNYQLIWQALEQINAGSIKISLPNGEEKFFSGSEAGPNSDIKIFDENLIDLVISGGDVAFGETYIQGLWDSSNLANLLTFLTLNSHVLEDFFHAKKFRAALLFLRSFFTKNTKRGSKKNIRAHYDLGNDFYALWLDESMTYSSAIFSRKDLSLAQAQQEKYRAILEKLNAGNVLEIGCGWGGFAKQAAAKKRKVTCLTISPKQREFALQRLESEGLADFVEIKLQDYRNEKGLYDNVVSIEMFEAVGKEYWDRYFCVLRDVLKQKGKAVLQIITIDELVFEDYKNRVDFIQKHIFPGGFLPSKTVVHGLANRHGFKVESEVNFGFDYAKTLSIWLERFDEKYAEIKALGFSQEFIRKWRFYLCYCIAGFLSKRTDVVQFELVKS